MKPVTQAATWQRMRMEGQVKLKLAIPIVTQQESLKQLLGPSVSVPKRTVTCVKSRPSGVWNRASKTVFRERAVGLYCTWSATWSSFQLFPIFSHQTVCLGLILTWSDFARGRLHVVKKTALCCLLSRNLSSACSVRANFWMEANEATLVNAS